MRQLLHTSQVGFVCFSQMLSYFHKQSKVRQGVEEMLYRLYQPILWRALKVIMLFRKQDCLSPTTEFWVPLKCSFFNNCFSNKMAIEKKSRCVSHLSCFRVILEVVIRHCCVTAQQYSDLLM